MLWRCWLGGRKGIWPVKNWVMGCWRGYLSGARCRHTYNPTGATVSCFSKIQIGFTILVPALPCSPGQTAMKRVCMCVLCIAEAESCRAAARGSSASATTAARASCRNCGTTADDRSSNGDCDNDRIIVDCSSAGSGSSSGANACDRVVVGGRGSAGDRRDLRADCFGDNVNGIWARPGRACAEGQLQQSRPRRRLPV